MTLEQDTDLSSEGESFSTTFTTGQKYNNQDKSNILILRAARLELESITLKQAMDDAVKKLQELSVANITTLVEQVSQIQKDVTILKTANKPDQTTIDSATTEFANIRNAITMYCSSYNNQSNNVLDEMRGMRLSTEDQLNKMFNIIGNTQLLLNHFCLNQQLLEEKIDQQRLNYENLKYQIMAQNKDILEIRQFLQLLVPRIISIEAFNKSLVDRTTPATADVVSPIKNVPKKACKRRKII